MPAPAAALRPSRRAAAYAFGLAFAGCTAEFPAASGPGADARPGPADGGAVPDAALDATPPGPPTDARVPEETDAPASPPDAVSPPVPDIGPQPDAEPTADAALADCPVGSHDGGDGACVPVGRCSPGFHDGGDEACVPVGACSPGFHDGGFGACVPAGACAADRHDDGLGRCVPLDRCAPGFDLVQAAGFCLHTLEVPVPEPWRGRASHTATLLADGRVLIAGGIEDDVTVTDGTWLFDPANGGMLPGPRMAARRRNHTATRLPDGRVLVAGGAASTGDERALATAELFDPGSDPPAWFPVPPLPLARTRHVAVGLPDGRVVVAGGQDHGTVRGDVYLFFPVNPGWAPLPALGTARRGHEGALLPDGRVMVFGGHDGRNPVFDTEILQMADGRPDQDVGWISGPEPPEAAQVDAASVVLDGGRILLTGGVDGVGRFLTRTWIWFPGPELGPNGAWASGNDLVAGRARHTATRLADGRVLLTGGSSSAGGESLRETELFDPALPGFRPAQSMPVERAAHTATRLNDGRVLVVGGVRFGTVQRSVTVYTIGR